MEREAEERPRGSIGEGFLEKETFESGLKERETLTRLGRRTGTSNQKGRAIG